MGVEKLLNATFAGGGGVIYLQNLPLEQVGYLTLDDILQIRHRSHDNFKIPYRIVSIFCM